MRKQLLSACFLIVGCALAACQQRTAGGHPGLEEGISLGPVQKEPGWFENISFENWFGAKKQPAEGAMVTYSEEPEENWVESLAPWNWFKDKGEDAQDEEMEKEKDLLDHLAFWNWFKDDGVYDKEDIFRNMSPELTSRAESKDEMRLRVNRTINMNMRGVWDDLLRGLFLDRASRLSMQPTP